MVKKWFIFWIFSGSPKMFKFWKIREINMKKWQKLCIFCDFLLQLLISRIDLCIDTRILVMFRSVDKNHQKYRSFSPKRWQISAKKHFYLDMLNGGYPLGNHLLDRISWEISAKKRIYLQIKNRNISQKKITYWSVRVFSDYLSEFRCFFSLKKMLIFQQLYVDIFGRFKRRH